MATPRTEDRTAYYYNNGKRVPLTSDPLVFAVAFQPGRKSDDPGISVPNRRFLGEVAEPVGFLPHYGLQIYRAVPENASNGGTMALIERTVRDLNDEAPVQFATRAVHRMDGEGNVSFLTRRFVVAFKHDVTPSQIDELNARTGARAIERLGYVEQGFLLEAPSGEGDSGSVALSNTYFETGWCDF